MKQEFYSDLHTHTNLSFCAPPTTTVESYLPLCEEEGLTVLGISNHVYSPEFLHRKGVPLSSWAPKLTALREELIQAEKSSGIRLLLGAEVENFPKTGPTLTPEEAADFDYVLIAASHIGNQRDVYTDYDLTSPDKIRKLLIDRFFAACELSYPVPMGICHPLYPLCLPDEQTVVDGISLSCLEECFSAAAERNISIEVHGCVFYRQTALNAEGLSDTYLRVLDAAKKCGCQFHFGSDAHSPEQFTGTHRLLRRAAEIVGITPDNLWAPAKGIIK
jgi:histidinol phosphatase-like PHP family hydrolase